MKNLWISFGFLLALVVAGCSGDDGAPKNVVLTGGTQTSQTVYADETQGTGGGISFTATADWVATVTEVAVSKAAGGSSVDWLTLSAYSGGAGEYTLTLTLKENNTGTDRKAKIEIACAGDVITITVEQKGTTEAGETPVEPVNPENVKYYVSRIDEEGSSLHGSLSKNVYYFEYDEQGRIVQVITDDGGTGDESEFFRTAYEFSGNTITLRQYYPYSDADEPVDAGESVPMAAGLKNKAPKRFLKTRAASETEDVTVFTLDDNNRVTTVTYAWYDGDDVVEGEAIVQYDANGYATGGTDTYTLSYDPGNVYEDVSKAEWQDGNLVKVANDYYGENSEDYVAEMRYENPAYINNPEVNVDLTWIICESEWMSCFITDMTGAVNAFGYMGKRGNLMMTHEYDRSYYGGNTEYSYEYDDLNRPVKVHKTCTWSDGNVSTYTYTITYMEI